MVDDTKYNQCADRANILFVFQKACTSTSDSVKTWCLWVVKWSKK